MPPQLARRRGREVLPAVQLPGGERRVQCGRGSPDASGFDAGFLGLLGLGHECREGVLCCTLVAGEAFMAVSSRAGLNSLPT